MFFWFLAALFRFVARFARVRIEDSSGNRFASTAYFAKPGFVGGECSGGKQPGWNLLGRNLPVTDFPTLPSRKVRSRSSLSLDTSPMIWVYIVSAGLVNHVDEIVSVGCINAVD